MKPGNQHGNPKTNPTRKDWTLEHDQQGYALPERLKEVESVQETSEPAYYLSRIRRVRIGSYFDKKGQPNFRTIAVRNTVRNAAPFLTKVTPSSAAYQQDTLTEYPQHSHGTHGTEVFFGKSVRVQISSSFLASKGLTYLPCASLKVYNLTSVHHCQAKPLRIRQRVLADCIWLPFPNQKLQYLNEMLRMQS